MDSLDRLEPSAFDVHPNRRLDRAVSDGVEIRAGDSVVLRPLGRADPFDMLLAGHCATVVSIEQDFEDRIYVAVTVDADPGNDFGQTGQPGHRFFFGIDEVEAVKTGAFPQQEGT
jgi:hypothetical protein